MYVRLAISIVLFTSLAHAVPFERELRLPSQYTTERVTQFMGIPAGETVTLLDLEGPAAITHLWMTVGKCTPRHIVLRMYWDGETTPSVEAPLSDFFGVGHNNTEPELYFATPSLSVAPKNGYNMYLPMPFRGRARITVTNDQEVALTEGGGLYFQADIRRYKSLAEDTPYFRAQWRREAPAQRRGEAYSVIEATGSGFVAGLTLHVRDDDIADKWYHGGGDMIFIDGPTAPNVLKGIGGEDFFGQSWASHLFASPYAGCTNTANNEISLYRFFLEGAPHFSHSIRVAFGAMENEITSVGYWYQTGPYESAFPFPPADERLPHQTMTENGAKLTLLKSEQIPVALIGPFAGTIDLPNPLDGLHPLPVGTPLLTNYGRPFMNTVPNETNRRISWLRSVTSLSWLDLEAIYKPKMIGVGTVQSMPGAVAFVLVRINSSATQDATLRIGHDDGVRAWLNGKPIATLKSESRFDLGSVKIRLDRGTNNVLLKVANDWNTNWAAFAVSLSLEVESPVQFYPFDNLPNAIQR